MRKETAELLDEVELCGGCRQQRGGDQKRSSIGSHNIWLFPKRSRQLLQVVYSGGKALRNPAARSPDKVMRARLICLRPAGRKTRNRPGKKLGSTYAAHRQEEPEALQRDLP